MSQFEANFHLLQCKYIKVHLGQFIAVKFHIITILVRHKQGFVSRLLSALHLFDKQSLSLVVNLFKCVIFPKTKQKFIIYLGFQCLLFVAA